MAEHQIFVRAHGFRPGPGMQQLASSGAGRAAFGMKLAVVVKTVLGSHCGWWVNSPPISKPILVVGLGLFWGWGIGAPPILGSFSGWIGMFTGGTIWLLTHGQLETWGLANIPFGFQF